ncbi:MAG: hypothetical protein JNL74_08225 [Fibrobacteres bacterium]|nr:hypothetical protein [Fibrobacterota bacterium]
MKNRIILLSILLITVAVILLCLSYIALNRRWTVHASHMFSDISVILLCRNSSEVVKNKEGTLFFKDNLKSIVDKWPVAQNAAVIAAFSDSLKKQGIDLYVAIVPSKEELYPEELPGCSRNVFLERIKNFQDEIKNRKVHVVDLATTFGEKRFPKLFTRFDTHWNDRGIDLAARAIINTLGLNLKESVKSETKTFLYNGDCARIIGDTTLIDTMTLTINPEPRGTLQDSSLLLLGDSFSMHWQSVGADIGSRINLLSGMPVYRFPIYGGCDGAGYYSKILPSLKGHKKILWIFASRTLSQQFSDNQLN